MLRFFFLSFKSHIFLEDTLLMARSLCYKIEQKLPGHLSPFLESSRAAGRLWAASQRRGWQLAPVAGRWILELSQFSGHAWWLSHAAGTGGELPAPDCPCKSPGDAELGGTSPSPVPACAARAGEPWRGAARGLLFFVVYSSLRGVCLSPALWGRHKYGAGAVLLGVYFNAVEPGCAHPGLASCTFPKKLLCLFWELIILEQIASNLRLIKYNK